RAMRSTISGRWRSSGSPGGCDTALVRGRRASSRQDPAARRRPQPRVRAAGAEHAAVLSGLRDRLRSRDRLRAVAPALDAAAPVGASVELLHSLLDVELEALIFLSVRGGERAGVGVPGAGGIAGAGERVSEGDQRGGVVGV